MMIGTGLLLCSLLSGLFGGGRISEQARQNERFDRMITAWSENVRTNTSLMTHAQFRDTVVVPFVSREVKNPFVDGGVEADKPWAEEGNLLFQRGLRAVCDTRPSAFYPMICEEATKLVKRGCRDPFIRIMSAIESGSGF